MRLIPSPLSPSLSVFPHSCPLSSLPLFIPYLVTPSLLPLFTPSSMPPMSIAESSEELRSLLTYASFNKIWEVSQYQVEKQYYFWSCKIQFSSRDWMFLPRDGFVFPQGRVFICLFYTETTILIEPLSSFICEQWLKLTNLHCLSLLL